MSQESFTLCADGGGSKLQLLLFDDHFRLRSTGKSGPVNGMLSPSEAAEQIHMAAEECTGNIPPGSIREAILSSPGLNSPTSPIHLFFQEILRHSPQAQCRIISEGKACLLAGSFRSEGFVALSGTGSGIFQIGEKEDHLGGWGHLLGDFGSGFLIGKRGIQAAIRGEEGWGVSTELIELACEEYGVSRLWDLVEWLYQQPFPIKLIAGFCRAVGKAANRGDPAAIAILQKSAREMADQAGAMLQRYPEKEPFVLVSGGSWKCSPLLYRFFSEKLVSRYPLAQVQRPVFEPVMGGVVLTLQERFPSDFRQHFDPIKEEFREFLYG